MRFLLYLAFLFLMKQMRWFLYGLFPFGSVYFGRHLLSTVYHSLTIFKGRTLLAALGGAVFAPLSYIAGARFGAVELGVSLMWSYIIIAIVWSVIFPLCFYLSVNFDRVTVKA
ncbi:DUF2878 family protein [Alteromonas gracilis]|uniref:DUF2878 family protein n=1 Tax=Alteromonas gracilis TaxID=1479524 RepID=UPI0030CD196B